MNTKTALRRTGAGRQSRDPVRLTALLYLREALREEKYEECPDIITIAYEFGATAGDVEALLEDSRRKPS